MGKSIEASGAGGGGPSMDRGWHISRRLGLILAVLAVSTVVIVGLLVYYVGVMGGVTCDMAPTTTGSAQLSAAKSSASKEKHTVVKDVRLPLHLTPLKYKVQLIPFIIPDNFTIDGYVSVIMEAKQSGSRNITLHSADMEVDHDTVRVNQVTASGDLIAELNVAGHDYDNDREFYITRLDQDLEENNFYQITMRFTAHLNDNLKGFYRSVYTNKKTGEVEYIAVTQFQATDARRAFPCFDEPGIKAKFEVSLGRLPDMSSISNMPIVQKGVAIEGKGDYVWDHYQESVPMSTYLVAFVVSRFGFEESPKEEAEDTKFRIWARKDALDQIAYAKEIGPKILKYFETYFDVDYPLPKQDMIAIPDFGAGAMENWGLITYRETALLYKPGVSAASNKQRIAVVISHELAHQWFGNLVTPSWWTDLWLNEGFASYVEYLGVEEAQPELKLLEQFVVNDLQSVFKIDALVSSHPISIPVKHPDEISEIFDRISYAKGASIIRMMDKFLTEKTFRGGLSNYLKAFAYKAAEQDDLWHYLTLQAHKDGTLPEDLTVKTIMDTWTLQMGFPVVTVTRDYQANGGAELRQDRFLLADPDTLIEDKHNYMWWVPINFAEPGRGNFDTTDNRLWMSNTEKTKSISGMPAANKPVIFNIQQGGYYRVNYDVENWKLIIQQLNDDHTQIHVVNRAQLIDDALNLARVGLLDYELALGVTSYLYKETEYIPWSAAMGNMGYIKSMLRRSASYGDFKKYIEKLVGPLYARVGFEEKSDDEHLDVFLRSVAVSWACNVVGLQECKEKATSQYRNWMERSDPDGEGQNPINVNMKRPVYCNAISNGDADEWQFAWDRYTNSNVATERDNLLVGLACSQEVWLLNRYLNRTLTENSGIRKADGRTVISRIAHNTIGRDLAFDFVRDKWDKILDYYGSSSFALSGLMKNVLADRNTQFSLSEIKRFQDEHKGSLKTAKRNVAQAVEKTEANLKWMNSNYETISSWLAKQI